MSDERDVSQRYRDLPREEPPRALDDAILSAARRAVEGKNRWYFPLAAAAVIVLAVAVTVQVQREQPDAEALGEVMMQKRAAEKPEPAPQPAPARKLQGFTPDPKPPAEAPRTSAPPPAAAADQARMKSEEAAARAAASDARESARVQAAPAAPVAAAAKPAPMLRRDEVARQSAPPAGFTPHSPEQWLQGIADLRRQGRDDEADLALAEFRKRHPDYKIPEAMLEKIEKK
ncbi:MAG: hypothetical protein ACREU1_09745 [Burkholderiales bacterium]